MSGSPLPPGSSLEAGAPTTATPSARPRWSRQRRVLVAVGLAAVLVAAGLVVYVEERPKPDPGPTGPLTFDQASTMAQSAASRSASGTWNPILGFAALTPYAIPIPLGLLGPNVTSAAKASNCTVSWLEPPKNLTLPPYTGAVGLGVSPDWWIVLASSSGGLMVVAVLNDTAQPLVDVGGQCSSVGGFVGTVSAGGTLDSPTIASSAQADGGATFLADHPGTVVTMSVEGGIPLLGLRPAWNVTYSSCDPLGPKGSSASLSLGFDGASGALLSEHNATLNCSLPTKLPSGTTAALLGPPPVSIEARGIEGRVASVSASLDR